MNEGWRPCKRFSFHHREHRGHREKTLF